MNKSIAILFIVSLIMPLSTIAMQKSSIAGCWARAKAVLLIGLVSLSRAATDYDLMNGYYQSQVEKLSGRRCPQDLVERMNCPNPAYYSKKIQKLTSPFKVIKDEVCPPCWTEIAELDAKQSLYKLKVDEILARDAKREMLVKELMEDSAE